MLIDGAQLDAPAAPAIRRDLGIPREGTRVTVPLADGRLPPNARLRRLVSDLVQLRPILEDETRELKQWDAVRVHKDAMRSFEGGPEGALFLAIGAPNTGPGDAEVEQDWWSD